MPLARLMHDFGHCVVARELFQVRFQVLCAGNLGSAVPGSAANPGIASP